MNRRTFLGGFAGGLLSTAAGCATAPITRHPLEREPDRQPPASESRIVRPRALADAQERLHIAAQRARTPLEYGENLPGLYRRDRFFGRIALTFDDGPKPSTTGYILNQLARCEVKATFFVIGRKAKKHPEVIRDIVAAGHTLGNHTYNHKVLSRLKRDTVAEQALRTERAVSEALGRTYRLALFRPPYGNPFIAGARYNRAKERIKDVLREQRRMLIMWNVPTGDTNGARSFDEMRARMHPYLRNGRGGVMVLHDTAPWAARNLRTVVDYLKEKDYALVTVKDLLERKYGVQLSLGEEDPRALWVTS